MGIMVMVLSVTTEDRIVGVEIHIGVRTEVVMDTVGSVEPVLPTKPRARVELFTMKI